MSIAANEMGIDVVMAPCNGCYHNLKKAEYDLAHDEASREVVDRISTEGRARDLPGRPGRDHPRARLDQARRSARRALRRRVKNSLNGLKVANYYGCMYTRPRHIFPEKDQGAGTESTSQPHFMDDLLAAAGAENVDFPLKTACCGGAHTLSDSRHLDQARAEYPAAPRKSRGADVIATECPTCHSGLEMHQMRAEQKVLGSEDEGQDALFHAVPRHCARPVAAQGRRARKCVGFVSAAEGDEAGMRSLAEIGTLIEREESEDAASAHAGELLRLGEEVLEHWVAARDKTPTSAESEGFRLLALHRQGAKSAPSFNACRETCRELVYHYNLISLDPDHAEHRKAVDPYAPCWLDICTTS